MKRRYSRSIRIWIAVTIAVAMMPAPCLSSQYVDLNNDGYTDIVGVGLDSVFVSLNDQSASFDQQGYPAGSSPSSLCAVDLDNDDYLDLAIASEDSRSLSVLINLGDGSFTDAASYETSYVQGRDICALDVNLDGFADLAILEESGRFIYFTNNGDGTFNRYQYGNRGYMPGPAYFIFGADMDGDGDHDIGTIGNLIAVRFNNGNGSFDPSGYFYADVFTPVKYAVHDFTMDESLDVILLGNNAALYTNNGYGRLSETRLWSTPLCPTVCYHTGYTTGDFDNDGDVDIVKGFFSTSFVIGKPYVTYVSTLMNNGAGEFTPGGGIHLEWSEYYITGCGDFNGDGILDIIGSGVGDGIMYGLGDGSFQSGIPTGVNGDVDHHNIPYEYSLSQNYPNPFNPVTVFEYSLPERSHVNIEIYNVLGQKVATLVGREDAAGSYTIDWNGTDASGKSVATGVYLYRLQAGDHIETKKMLLLK